jgi:hypothetical protein
MGLGASLACLTATTVVVCALVACGDLAENGTGDTFDGDVDSGASVDCPTCADLDAAGLVDDGSTVDSTLPRNDAAEDTGTSQPLDAGEDAREAEPHDAGGDTSSLVDSTLPEESGQDTGSPDEDTGTRAHDSGEDTGEPEDSGLGPHDSGPPDSGPHDSGVEDTGSPFDDSGQPSEDSGPADTGSPGDDDAASADGGQTIPDGGLPPTPGEVACGNLSCDVPENQCCIPFVGGAATCVPSTQACIGGVTVDCNEAADCSHGDVCCVSILGGPTTTAQFACQAAPCGSPADGHAQACRTNQECIGGAACTVQVCEGVTVELCGLPNFDNAYQCTPK